MPEDQSVKQKKIAFAQASEMVEAAIIILKESTTQQALVGDTEFETVVNAVTLDAQSSLIIKFLEAIDSIKNGSLHKT